MFDRRSFLSTTSAADFEQHLRQITAANPSRVLGHRTKVAVQGLATWSTVKLATMLPGRLARRCQSSVRLNESAYRDTRYDYLFCWALRHAMQRYM